MICSECSKEIDEKAIDFRFFILKCNYCDRLFTFSQYTRQKTKNGFFYFNEIIAKKESKDLIIFYFVIFSILNIFILYNSAKVEWLVLIFTILVTNVLLLIITYFMYIHDISTHIEIDDQKIIFKPKNLTLKRYFSKTYNITDIYKISITHHVFRPISNYLVLITRKDLFVANIIFLNGNRVSMMTSKNFESVNMFASQLEKDLNLGNILSHDF